MADHYSRLDITSGFGAETAINAELAKIDTAVQNYLSRSSSTDNAMAVDLDMGGNDILNANSLSIQLTTYAVAGVPSAAANPRAMIYVSDGSAGNPCIAVSDGANWKVVATISSLTTISAT